MDIYTPLKFIPTYLYIKQHKITKKLYFGKTINNPEKYNGSGIHWKAHIRKHGKHHIETLWYCLFYDEESISEFAELCSEQWNIVEELNESGDKVWANLVVETGRGDMERTLTTIEKMRSAKLGKPSNATGHIHTEESKEKNRIAHTGKKASEETKKKMSESGGHAQTEESKQKIRETLTGVRHDQERVEKMRASKLANPSRHRAGAIHSLEAKEKNRLAHLGKTFTKTPCLGCDKHIATQHMKRHMTKCKGIK